MQASFPDNNLQFGNNDDMFQPQAPQQQFGQSTPSSSSLNINLPEGQFGESVNGLLQNPMAAVAMGSAQTFAKGQVSMLLRLLSAHRLKYYFTVSNSYVLNKIKIVLCPLIHKKWGREELEPVDANRGHLDPSETHYKPPRDDINAPDLYIPTMAFLTYTLLMGYTLGTFGEFTPEVLGMTASSTLVTLTIEVLLLKLGFYLTSAQRSPSLLDLVAYCSYKNVGMVVEIVVALTMGNLAFYISVLLLGASSALFMMKTLKREMGGADAQGAGKKRMLHFLLIVGGMQIVFSFFMVVTVARSRPESVIDLASTTLGSIARTEMPAAAVLEAVEAAGA